MQARRKWDPPPERRARRSARRDPADQKSKVSDTFMSRGATTATGASQVEYVALALLMVSELSTLKRSRLITDRVRPARMILPNRASIWLKRGPKNVPG